MKIIFISIILLGLVTVSFVSLLQNSEIQESQVTLLKEKLSKKSPPSVDHTKFPELQKQFNSPQEVTLACLSCHNLRGIEVMHSNHWNWEEPVYIKDRGIVYLGKKNALNNFCLGTEGNELACAKCHVGYGMTSSKTFDFNDQKNIDCLACHDNTETYAKAQEKGGAPVATLDFANIAQNVGRPNRANCGVCHFYGGGGNNVKHGDLEKAMFEPTRDIDVHMAVDGVNLVCVDCHSAERHNIKGQLYSLASMNRNRVFCEDCHQEAPHQTSILNKHTYKVSCQTCHIPTYAKVNATKTYWDWKTAGKTKDGKPYEINDEEGNHIYLSTKGSFKWGKNLKPDYIWFNGTADHYIIGDKIQDSTKPLVLNDLKGSYSDKKSKIVPVKIMKTNQCFDPVNEILSIPKLFSPKVGEGAFWKDFDCLKALEVGMKELGLPFSGELSFIETEMNWPVNHMVSTKDKAVQCQECHTINNSRLANLNDFYMPARDRNPVIETAGAGILILSFFVVVLHGGYRIYTSRKFNKKG